MSSFTVEAHPQKKFDALRKLRRFSDNTFIKSNYFLPGSLNQPGYHALTSRQQSVTVLWLDQIVVFDVVYTILCDSLETVVCKKSQEISSFWNNQTSPLFRHYNFVCIFVILYYKKCGDVSISRLFLVFSVFSEFEEITLYCNLL